MMAEFESDLIRSRTRDATAAAAAAGKMKGRQNKLTPEERAYLMHRTRPDSATSKNSAGKQV